MEEIKGENLEANKSAKVKSNPWMYATIILVIAVVLLFAIILYKGGFGSSGSISGDNRERISSTKWGEVAFSIRFCSNWALDIRIPCLSK